MPNVLTGCRTLLLHGPHLLPEVAALVLRQEASRLPDLSAVTVLVPGPHAVPELQREFGCVAGRVLLLPHVTTLDRLAAMASLPYPLLPDSRREAMVYAALRQQRWFAGADLWVVAREIVGLVDELTRHGVPLPDGVDVLSDLLHAAYQARANSALQFEARVIHELWYSLCADPAAGVDKAAAQLLRLGALAGRADAALYVLGLDQPTRAESAFLVRHAERSAVTLLRFDPAGGEPLARLLDAACPRRRDDEPPLARRAASLRAAVKRSPAHGRILCHGAASLEQQAQIACLQVCTWLEEGCRDIAVVALDRLAVRRTRALLERAGVLMRDESGWRMSTTSAATAVMRWLELIAGDFAWRHLLDFVKSPFLLPDWGAERRKDAAWRLERLVRRDGFLSGQAALERWVAGADPDGSARALATQLLTAAEPLRRRNQTLAGWLADLMASLASLGVRASLLQDPAGTQVWQLLERVAVELADVPGAFGRGEFRAWLDRQFEGAYFLDHGIDSPVRVTSLDALALRRFDAVLVLGADADHLPGRPPAGLFSQAVRRELGLPLREEQAQRVWDALVAALAQSRAACLLWQGENNGEPNPASPFVESLEALHQVAWGQGLRDPALPARAAHLDALLAAREQASPPAASGRPAPSVPPALLPDRISVAAYNSLMACPYQFHARHVLRLAPEDEIREAPDKRDYGEMLHSLLHGFHRDMPSLTAAGRDRAVMALEAASVRAFASAVERNHLARAYYLRWRQIIGAYVDWQIAREAEGWWFEDGEVTREAALPGADGGTLRLHGRIDRIDRFVQAADAPVPPETPDAIAVIDYKTQNASDLRQRAAALTEDVQLLCYVLLAGGDVVQALYLGLDRDRAVAACADGPLGPMAQANGERLVLLLDAIRHGGVLPAHGIDAACRFCEVRGLCRKGHWTSVEAA